MSWEEQSERRHKGEENRATSSLTGGDESQSTGPEVQGKVTRKWRKPFLMLTRALLPHGQWNWGHDHSINEAHVRPGYTTGRAPLGCDDDGHEGRQLTLRQSTGLALLEDSARWSGSVPPACTALGKSP